MNCIGEVKWTLRIEMTLIELLLSLHNSITITSDCSFIHYYGVMRSFNFVFISIP